MPADENSGRLKGVLGGGATTAVFDGSVEMADGSIDRTNEKMDGSMVSVILPTYNEEEGIGPTMMELQQVLDDPEYLVIDRNSVDRTVEIAEKMGAKIFLQEGEGKGKAITQILGHVNSNTKYLVIIDADYTYPARTLRRMIETLEENPEVAMITGNRFDRPFVVREAMTNLYYLGNRLLSFIQYMVNRVPMRDPLTGLRVVRYETLKRWKPQSRGFDIEVELNHHIRRTGYRIREVPIVYRQRMGKKKLRLRHGFTILRRILLLTLQ